MPVGQLAWFLLATVTSLGASWLLVTRLERIGAALGLSDGLLGLVAALAADAPEVTAAVTAVATHQQRLGAGVVVGSNVFNLAALLGLGALVAGGIAFHRRVVLFSGTVAVAIAAICIAVSLSALPVVAGVVLSALIVAGYVLTLGRGRRSLVSLGLPRSWVAWLDRAVQEENEEIGLSAPAADRTDFGLAALAAVLVVGASVVMERTASVIGGRLGFSEIVTGGLVLAAVTSLPNAVAAVYLARRGRGPAALSTALNSNTINVVAGLLLPAVFIGLGPPSRQTTLVVAWYLGLTVVTLVLAYLGRGLGRGTGVLIIVDYVAFVAAVIISTRTADPVLQVVLAAAGAAAALGWVAWSTWRGGDSDRTAWAWRLALGLPLVIAAVDAASGRRLVLMGLLVAGPCCGLLTARWTRAAVATAWALVLAIGLGVPDGIWATRRQAEFVAAVLLVGATATVGARVLGRFRSAWADPDL